MERVLQVLFSPRGDRRWDIFIRATGLAALICIPLAIYFPSTMPIIWLIVLGVPVTGPLSPIFPAGFEPLIMEVAKYQPVLVVALAALAVYMYSEYLNWYVYKWILGLKYLKGFVSKKWVMRATEYFARWPFAAVVVFALTPLPVWVVRILAILDDYSLKRYMSAMAIGRFFRVLIYAWIGMKVKAPSSILFAVALGTALIVVVMRLKRKERVLADGVIDATR
jgi:membrane protein YqaA with SNARE-associated domain